MLSRLLVRAATPIACLWVGREEAWILRSGIPLTEAQLTEARRIGIAHPERVRILIVPQIPPRLHPVLRFLAQKFGMAFSGTIGMALGYGIFLRQDESENRTLLLHELAHVAQYERLGRGAFLHQYLHECLCLGYPLGALEAEAREVAQALSA